MTPDYISESLGNGLMGVPIGMVLGYALARAERFYHSHHGPNHGRRQRRDHT